MAEKKPESLLPLINQDVLLKRVASNFEKHGEENVPVLDITCETMLPPAMLTGLLGQYCDRTLFNQKGELLEPAEVFQHTKMPLQYDEDLVAQHAVFVLSDGIEREFGEEPDEGDEATPAMLVPISNIRYEQKLGGLIWTAFNIRIRPADADENWIFLEHQGRHAKLTIANSAIKIGNGKQQSLPLTQPDPPQPDVGAGFAAAAAARGGAPLNEATSSEGDATPPGYTERTTITNGDGDTTELRSGKEIDDEMNARAAERAAKSPEEKLGDDIGPETRKEIERQKSRRGPRPIDGRGTH